jgi:hypothetical protein
MFQNPIKNNKLKDKLILDKVKIYLKNQGIEEEALFFNKD